MKHSCIFLTLLCHSFIGNAQVAAPGAVADHAYWFVTDAGGGKVSFKSMDHGVPAIQLTNEAALGTLNYQPALRFSGKTALRIPFDKVQRQGSYFTVYQPDELSDENIIWHTKRAQRIDLVLTTNRLADLTDTAYMSFTAVSPFQPKVNTYIQNKDRDSTAFSGTFTWNIGDKPLAENLPVSSFRGLIPEVIVYNRVLDIEEQIRVSSYLALKYGITLTEPGATYLDSRGARIWNGNLYPSFHNNIAGIGRDDASGINITRAASSNTPDLLSFSAKASLENRQFLLWGDNNLPMVQEESRPGMPSMLQRKWLTVPTNITGPIAMDITIDTRQLDAEFPPSSVLWMAVDSTENEDFSSSTMFVPMSGIDKNRMAHFRNVLLPGTGKNILGFAIGGELLFSASVSEPTCSNQQSGSISARVWGGAGPYVVTIFKNNRPLAELRTASPAQPCVFDGLGAGAYTVTVKDSRDHRYQQDLIINNADAPRPAALQPTYILQEGRRLSLDASQGMSTGSFYQWVGPGNYISFSPVIEINKEGTYLLTTGHSGCSYTQAIKIKRPPKNVFTKVKVYPNPSQGAFAIQLQLDQPAPVVMNVYRSDGKWIASRQFKGMANYTIDHFIASNGVYFLEFKSGLSVLTEKIIIGR